MAVENFILSLQQQVKIDGGAALSSNDVLTTDINLSSPEKTSNTPETQNLSVNTSSTNLKNNLSHTSSSGIQSEVDEKLLMDQASESIGQEIAELVNRIVLDAVIKAKQLAEEDEQRMIETFELVNKTELTQQELEQIEAEEKRSVDVKEVKFFAEDMRSDALVTIDHSIESVLFKSSTATFKSDVENQNQTAVINETNDATLNTTTATTKKNSKKGLDIDCFSCSVL